MAKVPENLKYTQTHEWLKKENAVFFLGITDYAQEALGDVVFVELPEVGKTIKKGDAFAVVESVKAASDIYTPMDGKIIAVNTELNDHPDLINQNPYGAWLVQIEAQNEEDFALLLSSSDYAGSLD